MTRRRGKYGCALRYIVQNCCCWHWKRMRLCLENLSLKRPWNQSACNQVTDLVPGTAHNGGEDSSRCIVSCKTCLTHPWSIVNHQSSYVFISHIEGVLCGWWMLNCKKHTHRIRDCCDFCNHFRTSAYRPVGRGLKLSSFHIVSYCQDTALGWRVPPIKIIIHDIHI